MTGELEWVWKEAEMVRHLSEKDNGPKSTRKLIWVSTLRVDRTTRMRSKSGVDSLDAFAFRVTSKVIELASLSSRRISVFRGISIATLDFH